MKIINGPKAPAHTRSLAYLLHAQVACVRPGRPLTRIHASSVTQEDWCPRRHALLMATGTGAEPEPLGTSQALAFGISIMVAEQIIAWAADAGIAIGDWKCLRCGKFYVYCKRPDECRGCKGGKFSYVEHRFRSTVSGISGGVDLILRIPGMKLDRVVELKALMKEAFQALKMPLQEHRLRTNLYLRLVDESDDPAKQFIDTDTATVFYVTKGGYGQKSTLPREWGLNDMAFTPFKEFEIAREDSQTEKVSKMAEGLWDFIQDRTQVVPPGVCVSSYSSLAQHCPMKKPCFSGKYGKVQ